jgi:CHAT domain-containing protein
LLFALASCAVPPKDAYTTGGTARTGDSVPLGANAAGEACSQSSDGPGRFAIYCGTWKRPSAHLQSAAMPATGLALLATASPWRRGLDNSFDCGAPTPTNLRTGPALLMHCTRLLEGFPQLALVAQVDSQVWLADGVPAAAPVIERAIAFNTGRISAAGMGEVTESPGLAAERLAGRAASAGDLDAFDEAIRKAARANLEGDYAAAEDAYRATLTVQRRVLGPDAPDTARTLALQALQVSNLHRYGEADAMLARAETLAAGVGGGSDSALPLVWHYQGLNLLNQHKPREALVLLQRAEQAYLRLAPAAAENAASGSDVLPADKDTQAAALGVVEVHRAQATAYRMLGDTVQATRQAEAADASLRTYGLRSLRASARILRTEAAAYEAAGDSGDALDSWQRAADRFARALPGSRSYAETQLLLAADLARNGQTGPATEACRAAEHVLRGATAGVPADKLAPCLALLADPAGHGDQQAARDMFALAELAQGGTTSQQIALVSARLAENKRDPKVAALIRERDDANAALGHLYESREDIAAGSPAEADLNGKIAAAEKQRDALEEALQSASPNYGQLVQQAVSADDILHALRPGEVFADFVLGSDTGWVFVLRDGQIGVAPVAGGAKTVDPLVARIRRSVDEPADGGGLRPFDTDAASTLYADLLGGVGDRLGGATALTVAPSGTLLSVPFGLLLTGAASPEHLPDAPFLIRKLVIAHVPAPANFVQLRRLAGTSRARKPWFGFGDFVPVTVAQADATFPVATCHDSAALFANLPRLPGAVAELDQARALVGAARQDELLGSNFTASRVLSTPLSDYRLLHFATHALLQTDLACQTEPALVASAPPGARDAQGALLTASQVAGLKLDADAVLLSACNTGGPGGSAPGESLSGLARSFFYAGARAMLVTHWDVNDRVTSVLVGTTLALAKQDSSLGMAAALADSQRRLLAKSKDLPNLAHPFFWAPLALIGDGTSGVGARGASVAVR